jgi:hypothetical protein
MAADPTTPTREHAGIGGASEDEVCSGGKITDVKPEQNGIDTFDAQDTYEDAPDITPRPRGKSPEATRSLTERRTSVATLDGVRSGDMITVDGVAEHPPTTNGDDVEVAKENRRALHEEQAKGISVSDMDEINLGDGKSRLCLHSLCARLCSTE